MCKLLTPKQAAEQIGLSISWLQKKRLRGGGPPYVRLGPQAVRYQSDDLEAWIKERAARAFASTTEEASIAPATGNSSR